MEFLRIFSHAPVGNLVAVNQIVRIASWVASPFMDKLQFAEIVLMDTLLLAEALHAMSAS